MNNYDSLQHVRGESQFIDDLIVPENTLFASVFYSPSAHGIIKSIYLSQARNLEGVKGIFTSSDIPGQNQIGGIVQDEELLAADKVMFAGQPVAIVAASDQRTAVKARNKIQIEIDELPVITGAREAYNKGELIIPPRIFSCGNIETAWDKCDVIVEGEAESGAQEHIYLETQGALAIPAEGGGIKVYSSTQAPTAVQRTVARVLNLPMHKVEVDVLRLGGGFGGKEDQANSWAALAALAASRLNEPVKLILSRQEDMFMTGKRHPYSSDFKIGLTNDGKIIAYEVTFYQNAGASADLSPAILDRTLFHTTNSYYIPNVKATGLCCRTNLPPNTAFRGFGGPQAMFVLESAIYKAAEKMGIEPIEIQKINLLSEGDEFPYGQRAINCHARTCWENLNKKYNYTGIQKKIAAYNLENTISKKGFAIMPVCFGISFTNTFMNQASALVHIYSDGSVGISTGAVEMGQGVNEKIRQVASTILSINSDRIKIESSNTTRAANTSPTAASSAADLNGKAVELACRDLIERLKKTSSEILNVKEHNLIEVKEEHVFYKNIKTGIGWSELINKAFLKRVSLSSQAHYSTPGIYFDKDKSKGKAFSYYSYGTAVIEITLDCMLGKYEIDSVKIMHDFGKSFVPAVDRGQAEGALIQGIGWMTIEEILFSKKGQLMTNALSTYKVPDIQFTPKEIEVNFLENSYNPMGIFNSKAIGEPPLMYGIGVYFALTNAMKSFRPDKQFCFSAPLTPEKILLSLYSNIKEPAIP